MMNFVMPIYVSENEQYWLGQDGLKLISNLCSRLALSLEKNGNRFVVLSDNESVLQAADGAGMFYCKSNARNHPMLPKDTATAIGFMVAEGMEGPLSVINFRSLDVPEEIILAVSGKLGDSKVSCTVGVAPFEENQCQLFLYTNVLFVGIIEENDVEGLPYKIAKADDSIGIAVNWDALGEDRVIVRVYSVDPTTSETTLMLESTDREAGTFAVSKTEGRQMVFCALKVDHGQSHYVEPFRPIEGMWTHDPMLRLVAKDIEGRPITGRQWAPTILIPSDTVASLSAEAVAVGIESLQRDRIVGVELDAPPTPIESEAWFRIEAERRLHAGS